MGKLRLGEARRLAGSTVLERAGARASNDGSMIFPAPKYCPLWGIQPEMDNKPLLKGNRKWMGYLGKLNVLRNLKLIENP